MHPVTSRPGAPRGFQIEASTQSCIRLSFSLLKVGNTGPSAWPASVSKPKRAVSSIDGFGETSNRSGAQARIESSKASPLRTTSTSADNSLHSNVNHCSGCVCRRPATSHQNSCHLDTEWCRCNRVSAKTIGLTTKHPPGAPCHDSTLKFKAHYLQGM